MSHDPSTTPPSPRTKPKFFERLLASIVSLGLASTIFLLLLIFPLFVKRPFFLNIFIFVFMYALIGVGWNVIGGYAGQPALGNALFFGLGAYTSGLMLKWWGISPWVGLFVGMMVSSLAAVLIGLPTFRLRGHYFAIATLALTEVARQIFNWWQLVGGANGVILPVLPETLLNFEFHSSRVPYYYIILFFLVIALAVTKYLEGTRLGYYLRAINADQRAASSLGINVSRCKMIAFIVSAAMTSAAGTFYAQYVLYFEPLSAFYYLTSLQAVLVATVGGLGWVWGPIIGAMILVPISELTRTYLAGTGRAVDLLLYGLIVMVLAAWEPRGVLGLVKRYSAWSSRRRVAHEANS